MCWTLTLRTLSLLFVCRHLDPFRNPLRLQVCIKILNFFFFTMKGCEKSSMGMIHVLNNCWVFSRLFTFQFAQRYIFCMEKLCVVPIVNPN